MFITPSLIKNTGTCVGVGVNLRLYWIMYRAQVRGFAKPKWLCGTVIPAGLATFLSLSKVIWRNSFEPIAYRIHLKKTGNKEVFERVFDNQTLNARVYSRNVRAVLEQRGLISNAIMKPVALSVVSVIIFFVRVLKKIFRPLRFSFAPQRYQVS